MFEDEVELFDLVDLFNLGDPARVPGRIGTREIQQRVMGTGVSSVESPRAKIVQGWRVTVPLEFFERDHVVADLFDREGAARAFDAGGDETICQRVEGRGRVGSGEGERAELRGCVKV